MTTRYWVHYRVTVRPDHEQILQMMKELDDLPQKQAEQLSAALLELQELRSNATSWQEGMGIQPPNKICNFELANALAAYIANLVAERMKAAPGTVGIMILGISKLDEESVLQVHNNFPSTLRQ